LPKDIGGALLAGVAIAGIVSALVPAQSLSAYLGGGIGSIVLLMLAGVPIYVCATASIPIAVGFMHFGASPGAALAFLIAGPATNAATIATIWRVMGRKTAVIYLLTVAFSAVGCGLLFDWLYPLALSALPAMHEHQHEASGFYYDLAAVALLLVVAYSYLSERGESQGEEVAGDKTVLKISGMTCAHCVEGVRKALAACGGVNGVNVNLSAGTAEIGGKNLQADELTQAVARAGYEAKII